MNSKIKNWIMAIRPKTLTASIGPVMIATAMAFGDGVHHFPTAVLCLLAAIAVQIGTNLANDFYDFKKGTDTSERIGPIRVTQAGLIKPETVKFAFIGVFIFFGAICLILFYRGGWPIIILGAISIVSGIFYTAGPKPLGYVGLGDFFVLIFFGPVTVAATYYLQSYEINMAVIWAGIGVGLISVAILVVNNLRDINSDRKADKKTLAVRFGRTFSQLQYMVCIVIAALIPVFIHYYINDHAPIVFASLILFPALAAFKTILETTDGMSLNETLAYTGKILLAYSIIFSIGWIS